MSAAVSGMGLVWWSLLCAGLEPVFAELYTSGMGFKNDRFRKTRGGYSRWLQVTCHECGSRVCTYQKDGAGNLRRMYIDRIAEPKVNLGVKELRCPKGHTLGSKIVYKKENRPAFRLFVDAVEKKIIKSR